MRRTLLGAALLGPMAVAPAAHSAAGFGCGGQHLYGDLEIGYCISTDANGVHVGGVRIGGPPRGIGYLGHAQLTFGGYQWEPGSRHLADGPDDFLMPSVTVRTRPVAYWVPGKYCVTWWTAEVGTKPFKYIAEPGYCRIIS